jgi:hypothetical protein
VCIEPQLDELLSTGSIALLSRMVWHRDRSQASSGLARECGRPALTFGFRATSPLCSAARQTSRRKQSRRWRCPVGFRQRSCCRCANTSSVTVRAGFSIALYVLLMTGLRIFCRQWRLASRVSCFVHGCGFWDRCPACRSGIAAFDQTELIPQHFCARCGVDLCGARRPL